MADGRRFLTCILVLVLEDVAKRAATTDDSDASSIQDNDEFKVINDTSISMEENRKGLEFEQLFNLTTNLGASNSMAKKLSSLKRKIEGDIQQINRKKNKVPSFVKDKTLRKVGAPFFKHAKVMPKEQKNIEESFYATENDTAPVKVCEIIQMQNTELMPDPRVRKFKRKIAKINKEPIDKDNNDDRDETPFKLDSMFELEKQGLITQKLLSDKMGILDEVTNGDTNSKSYKKEHRCDDGDSKMYIRDTRKCSIYDHNCASSLSDQSTWHNTQNDAIFNNNDYSSPVQIFPNGFNANIKKNNLNGNVINIKINVELEMPQKKEETVSPVNIPTYERNPFANNLFKSNEINLRVPFYGKRYDYPRRQYQARNNSILYIPSNYNRSKMNNRIQQKEYGITSSRLFDNFMNSTMSRYYEPSDRLRFPPENSYHKERPKLKFKNAFSRLINGKKYKAKQFQDKKGRNDKFVSTTSEMPVVLHLFNDSKRDEIANKSSYYDNVMSKYFINNKGTVNESQNTTKERNELNAGATSTTGVLEDIKRNKYSLIKTNNTYNGENIRVNTINILKKNETKLEDRNIPITKLNVSIDQLVTTDSILNISSDDRNITKNSKLKPLIQILIRKKRFVNQSQMDDTVHRSNVGEQKDKVKERSKIQLMQSMVKYAGMYATGTLTYCGKFSCYSVRCGLKRCAQVDCIMHSHASPSQMNSDSVNYEEPGNATAIKKQSKAKHIIRKHCNSLDYAELKAAPENGLPCNYIFDFMNNMKALLSEDLYGTMTVCRQGRCLTIVSSNDVNTSTFCNISYVDADGHCYQGLRRRTTLLSL